MGAMTQQPSDQARPTPFSRPGAVDLSGLQAAPAASGSPVSRNPTTTSARAATVDARTSRRNGTSTPNSWRIRSTTFVASSEWPPSSVNTSSAPIGATPSTTTPSRLVTAAVSATPCTWSGSARAGADTAVAMTAAARARDSKVLFIGAFSLCSLFLMRPCSGRAAGHALIRVKRCQPPAGRLTWVKPRFESADVLPRIDANQGGRNGPVATLHRQPTTHRERPMKYRHSRILAGALAVAISSVFAGQAIAA